MLPERHKKSLQSVRGELAKDQLIELTVQQLHWLLDGIDFAAMRGHAAVSYKKAA